MAKTRIRVLLIEDDMVDQMAFKRLVKSENLPYDYSIAESVTEARKFLETEKFDVVIMDYQLGDGTSFDLLGSIDSQRVPIVFATGTGDEEIAIKAMKAGAYDYLIKDLDRNYLKVLAITIENAIKHKQTDEQLSMLSHALMSTHDSVYITDMTDSIIFVNKSFCQTYGYNEADILGKDCHILLESVGEDWQDTFPRVFEDSEFSHKRKDGSRFPVSVSRSIIKDKNDKEIATVAVARDITERKRVENELRELNISKDKFFSIISHDLRSPFTHLLGFTEILSEEIETLSHEEIQQIAQAINRSARNLSNLLDNLLQWASIQRGRIRFEPDKFELNRLIKANLDLLRGNAARKDISLQHELEDDTFVYADQHMINSVIQNLISNAIKFTDKGGQVRVTSKRKDRFVEVSVSDTGIGLSQEDMAKLFRIDTHHITYGTDDERGTGLGLILCKEFVERNGGQIWVESEFDRGSTFRFLVPLAPQSDG